MRVVSIDIKRSHYGATVEEVCEAFNVGKGQSTLLAMSVAPGHRSTVEGYREVVAWKLAHTEGDALAKWLNVAEHLDLVLHASKPKHDFNARRLALQERQ